jgi:hypothetical protein
MNPTDIPTLRAVDADAPDSKPVLLEKRRGARAARQDRAAVDRRGRRAWVAQQLEKARLVPATAPKEEPLRISKAAAHIDRQTADLPRRALAQDARGDRVTRVAGIRRRRALRKGEDRLAFLRERGVDL